MVIIAFLLLALPGFNSEATSYNTLVTMQAQNQTDAPALQAVAPTQYAYQDQLHRDTPRGALAGFINAAIKRDYQLAALYLDLRYLAENKLNQSDTEYAQQLHAILERNIWINLEDISDSPNGMLNDQQPEYRDLFGQIEVNGHAVTLWLQKVPDQQLGTIWKISNATLSKVPKLYQELGYSPIVEWFIRYVPDGYLFKINLWEWALLLSYFVSAFIITLPVTWLFKWLLLRSQYQFKQHIAAIITGPLRLFLTLLIDRAWLANTTLSALATELVNTGVLFVLTIMWLVWSLISLFQHMLREHLISKGNKQGASLLRPLINFVKVVLLILAILIWLEHLGFNASAILAGMGIGGIAIALASKQSIENLIGTMTLYSAAPIKVGNLCNFGGMRGTVEEIGLRCTRIRTLDRSVIHVPNAKLAEMEIENISEREKIRFKSDIRLDYATTSAQLKAITEDIKTVFEAHELVDKSPLRVTFKGFGLHGLEVNIFAYLATTSLPKYQLAAEQLQYDIMDIVAKHGSKIVPVAPYAQA
ncbi:mechanosensitive ion channel family protein [Pseudoalteromonas tunicata]|nr:mechanosensitive ion channel family protein [Pseudoalteromonas tunicata]